MRSAQTFLFTDLEGSTRTWERDPEAMDRWLAQHDQLVSAAIRSNGGRVFKHTGDGFCAVFACAADAARAAREIQIRLTGSTDDHMGPLRARVALHAGTARERAGDFFGPTLNRCARLLSVGHGGQILLSATACELVHESGGLADGLTLVDLGKHRLRDLQQPEHIWQLSGPGLASGFEPLRSLDAFLHNLPLQRSSFIGRDTEARSLRDLLSSHRLVTVTGMGGCGKTRLALDVAAAEVEHFSDGVFFADLSNVVEPTLVAAAMGAALRAPMGPGTSEDRVTSFLADRHTLLVVDNCEHLLDGCDAVIDRVLAECPRVKVLATSREPLALDGERVWRVPSLRVPEKDSFDEIARAESVRLFVDRAAAVRPGFVMTAENAGMIAEVCRRLDGIPLAIELAAARVAHLTPSEIVARLADRFRLLRGGRRGVQRQQTLQAVLDWSHDLLGDVERILLRRLTVFAGGWTLEAAQGVCAGEDLDEAEIVDALGSLVTRSLVDVEDRGDHTRYRLLETVRMYAQERLVAAGEARSLRSAHAAWYLSRADSPPKGCASPVARLFFGYEPMDLVDELDNMSEALDWWRAEGRYDLMLRIVASTVKVFQSKGRYEEPAEWLSFLLAHAADLPPQALVHCHAVRAEVAEIRGEFSVANEEARKAIASATNPDDAGPAYSLLLANLMWAAPDEAQRILDHAADWAAPMGSLAESFILAAQGSLACARHDYDRAIDYFSHVDSRRDFAVRRLELSVAHLFRGDCAEASHILDSVFASQQQPRWAQYFHPFLRALIAAAQGDGASARAELIETVAGVRRWKIPLGLADCATGCAAIAFHEGDVRRASEILSAVRSATGGAFRSPMSVCIYRHYVRGTRGVLDLETAAEARAAGARLTLEDVLERELG